MDIILDDHSPKYRRANISTCITLQKDFYFVIKSILKSIRNAAVSFNLGNREKISFIIITIISIIVYLSFYPCSGYRILGAQWETWSGIYGNSRGFLQIINSFGLWNSGWSCRRVPSLSIQWVGLFTGKETISKIAVIQRFSPKLQYTSSVTWVP